MNDDGKLNGEAMCFGREDGVQIKANGSGFHKVSPTWVWDAEMTEDFYVETAEGRMLARAGDVLCYDEKSGNVWPVNPSYVAQNYQKIGMEDVSAQTPPTHVLYQALEALSAAARHLSATDVANAEVNLAEPRYRPLTQLCGGAAAALQEMLEETVGLATGEHAGPGHDAGIIRMPQPVRVVDIRTS